MIIVGAGLSGLIAATIFQDATVHESSQEPKANHQALLRFRSDVVSNATGIDFRRVRVRKGIWDQGAFSPCTIRLANLYSIKTLGIVADRSIWSLDSVDRWIAPLDFYAQLLLRVEDRVFFNSPVDFSEFKGGSTPIISTAPLFVAARALLPGALDEVEFRHAGVHVLRGKVVDCDVNQTIYYPTPRHALYRASITGDELIMEFTEPPTHLERMALAWEDMLASFGLDWSQIEISEKAHPQQFGKIAPIDELVRKAAIHSLSTRHEVYSLGRFATWRNILLDDIIQDCSVIKKLMSSDYYRRKLIQG